MVNRESPAGGDRRTYARGVPQRGDLARRSLLALVVGAAAVFAVLAQFGENGIVTWWRLRGETARLEGQVADLERQNALVDARLAELAADPEAVEFLARERYGMRRPDEEVLTVLQAPSADPAAADALP
ncbi:MAG: septum formation initiator family protein [Krumholzibacteria bacterium]|nr:septum formation initiator family protein [Candidatus Krumholzibacteria bacterium]